MNKREIVVKRVLEAIEEVNGLLPDDKQLEKTINTRLFGPSGLLDSLGLINMIVATEQKILQEFGVMISLAGEKAVPKWDEIFETVDTLADYICENLGK